MAKELAVGEEVTSTSQPVSAYTPEGNLPDLLTAQTTAVAAVPTQPLDTALPAPSETVSTSVVVQGEIDAPSVSSTVTGASALPSSLQAPDQQSKADQLVTSLHGSEPPPADAQNIHLTNGQTVTALQGLVVDSGETLSGNGVVVGDILNRGTLSPGNSPGIVNIIGDAVLDPAGSLVIQIGGRNAGPGSPVVDDGFDQLNVSGVAALGGTLQIDLINDFVPKAGDSFTIMTYGSATGAFDTVNGLVIGDGLVFKLEQGPTELRLSVLDPSDLMSIVDTVFSGKTTSFTETVTPGRCPARRHPGRPVSLHDLRLHVHGRGLVGHDSRTGRRGLLPDRQRFQRNNLGHQL